jgi:hypothetical protein
MEWLWDIYAARRLIQRTLKPFILLLPIFFPAQISRIAFQHIKITASPLPILQKHQGSPESIIDNEHTSQLNRAHSYVAGIFYCFWGVCIAVIMFADTNIQLGESCFAGNYILLVAIYCVEMALWSSWKASISSRGKDVPPKSFPLWSAAIRVSGDLKDPF